MSELSIKELERRMRPGEFSQAGFLGWGESLVEVLEQDARTLDDLGVPREEIADALEALLSAAVSKNMTTTQRKKYRVHIHIYPGFQICPFAIDPDHEQCTASGGVRFGSVDWEIENRRTGQRMKGPGLISHLIRAHGFFEGVESPYRIDPADMIKLLELAKI
ncbi:MAG: hypothetical protein PHW11_08965 [Anaerolineaceae bacterium]|nr:hypothetical protein [Anaerolineaceae bacterium]MDD4043696.1 hypothetical protein [Anaerolineaceae bacterium]MDD4577706.1 hypothetical protein [Anaerolineaceae bacterium]